MKIEINNLNEVSLFLKNSSEKIAKNVIREVTQEVFENLHLFARPHHKTGMLEKNIRHKVKKLQGFVWIDDENMLVDWNGKKVNYAEFVLKGTRPHKIRPKKRKSLRYSSLNDFVFSKEVNHPGYEGDDFLKKGVDKTMSQLNKIMQGVENGL